jgi:hypothetical protein
VGINRDEDRILSEVGNGDEEHFSGERSGKELCS